MDVQLYFLENYSHQPENVRWREIWEVYLMWEHNVMPLAKTYVAIAKMAEDTRNKCTKTNEHIRVTNS